VSAIALQRVVVRMMYDPVFRERVYTNPDLALREVPLTPQERQWLVTPAPSAYGADAYRGSRALTGLLEEFPVAGALAVRLPRGTHRLQQFFATPIFHQCVQERGSMAMAFGSYLGSKVFRSRQTWPEMAPIAMMETAIAQVRRASPLFLPPLLTPSTASVTAETLLGLAPWVALLTVHADTLQRYSELLATLQQRGGALIEAVLDTKHHLPHGPAFRGKATEFVLVSHIPGSDGPCLERMNDDLGKLLAAAKTPQLPIDLSTLVEDMGCTSEEAQEVIAGLIDDRILHACL
jgi:hypothetical protein